MLIEAGLLTEEALRKALQDQPKSPLKLGQLLARRGLVGEGDLAEIVSRQLNIERYHPDHYPIDLSLVQLIPIELAQQHQIAPIRKKGRLLTIATIDPLDIHTLDAIEMLTGCEVEPAIGTEREINQLISSIYGIQSTIGTALENLEIDTQRTEDPDQEDVQVASLQDLAAEAPVIRLVNTIFSQAVREGASDIHISPQQNSVQIRFRIDGKLYDVPAPRKSSFLSIVARIKILSNMDITVSRVTQDGRFTLKMDRKEINVRVSSIPTIYGENLVLRLLDTSGSVYSLDGLGMVESDIRKIKSIINKPYGMILSTGPTGSGKSTTIYAILNELNRPDCNIMTLEDPVEYRIDNIRQIQLNRKAGMSFASGLRTILRQDPDIIMVGEIRDPETAAIAVQAAQTGHRVLSTVHTNDAAGAISRFIDMDVEPFLISSVLLATFAQRLVRTICPYCKERYQPPKEALIAVGLDGVQDAGFQRGRGCSQCLNTGYKGRTGIFEVLINDEMIQHMILERRSAQEITREAKRSGRLRTLQEDAAGKVLQGITTLEEAATAVMM
ncbi:MAG: Type II secretion system protein E [Syntrophaceae bacterium PtaB.Bin095]|nr:MAG: Type II secretion system protein E [Syntrophaceae bacterium PtaB.Bin095]